MRIIHGIILAGDNIGDLLFQRIIIQLFSGFVSTENQIFHNLFLGAVAVVRMAV